MYFNSLDTVGRVKTEYRKLAKLNHPDLGGVTAVMQAINIAYHAKLASLNGETSVGTDGKEHTYHYRREVEQEVMDKIAELLGLRLPDDVTVELVGTWIWIYGNTKPHKEAFKKLDCRWHSKRGKWYWRRFTYRRSYSGASFDTLRHMYGSEVYEDSRPNAVAVA